MNQRSEQSANQPDHSADAGGAGAHSRGRRAPSHYDSLPPIHTRAAGGPAPYADLERTMPTHGAEPTDDADAPPPTPSPDVPRSRPPLPAELASWPPRDDDPAVTAMESEHDEPSTAGQVDHDSAELSDSQLTMPLDAAGPAPPAPTARPQASRHRGRGEAPALPQRLGPPAPQEVDDSPAPPDDELIRAWIQAGLLKPATAAAAASGAIATLDDRYDLKALLGKGGMGAVFAAYDAKADCEVAVKLLQPRFMPIDDARRQFLDEAKAMHRMPAHASAVVIKDLGTEARPYYVMEHMPGGSLASRLHGSPLSNDEALRIALQLAKALEYVHTRLGKMHRDVKPENVLLAEDGSARLADFGLIRGPGQGAKGMRAGTLPYMPPELVADKGLNIGFEWDIYSFGATLYHMLTGQPPYADTLADAGDMPVTQKLRQAIAEKSPRPVQAFNRRADKRLVRVIEGAMARDRRDRYVAVADIVADLKRIEQGHWPLGPTQREAKRGGLRQLAALSAAAILLLIGPVVGITLHARQPLTPGGVSAAFAGLFAAAWPVDPTPTPASPADAAVETPPQVVADGGGNSALPADGPSPADATDAKPNPTQTRSDPPPLATNPAIPPTGNPLLDGINPTPTFALSVKAGTATGEVDFRDGERMTFEVQLGRPAYVYFLLHGYAEGEPPTVIFPNQVQTDPLLDAGMWVIPRVWEQIPIRASAHHGDALIKVIASAEPLIFPTQAVTHDDPRTGLPVTENYFILPGDFTVDIPSRGIKNATRLDQALRPNQWATTELFVPPARPATPREVAR